MSGHRRWVEVRGLARTWRSWRTRGARWNAGRGLPLGFRTAVAVVGSVLVVASPVRAQSSDGALWMLDVEPLPILSAGIGASLRYFPTGSRFGIGISGVTQDVDGFAQDVVFDGADALETRMTWAVGVEASYFLRSAQRGGFHATTTVGVEEFRARTQEPVRLEDARRNGFASLQLGYVWYPGLGRFFINPRVGGITTFATDRERTIGDASYELAPFFPSAWLRLGLRF